MNNSNRGESHTMAEEAEENPHMTPKVNKKKQKLVRLRDALWDLAKTVGAVAVYMTGIIVIVKYFHALVELERMAVDYAILMAVLCTAVLHAFVGLCYITAD